MEINSMCGICGIMSLDHQALPPDGSLIERMTDTLAHRGPNDRGTWCNERIALGSRRLSVIDLSRAGHMPMGNEDGSIQIVYNGEVYNFRELKKRHALEQRGHVFRSQTDTEVVIHLYEEIGLEMVNELNGQFAIAIWDSRRQELILIRDRYGIKPLFYQQDAGHFRFGSEIKAIIADQRVARKPSLQALHDFLTFDYIPGQQTAFENIYEVPPAHWMVIDTQGNIRMRPYWELSFEEDDSLNEREVTERALDLMDRSVQRRLIADVPIGVLLSGGMDSSVVTALMHRHTNEQIHTYSVGFEQASFNELPYARMVAQQFNTVQREVIVTPQLVRDLLPKYLSYIDEPYADGSAIPTYYVCQIAKDEVVVVLSGEGGDEAFAGYETYSAYQVSKWFSRVPRWVRRGLIQPLVSQLPVSDKKLSLEFKMKRFLGGQDLNPAQAHLWWRIVLTEAQKLNLYSSQVLEQLEPQPSGRIFTEIFHSLDGSNPLSKLMYIDSNVFLPDDLMIKNDRMSMAHSLEARVPMTDPELTAFMASVPVRLKFPRLRKKHIMRRAMQGILPPVILNKKKVGLEMPYSKWFKKELNDLLVIYLDEQRIADTGLFRPRAVKTLVDDHIAGRVDNGRAIWGLLNYMMWLELYIS
jgi:asparagine synthase (glutamine-hydrolysing)